MCGKPFCRDPSPLPITISEVFIHIRPILVAQDSYIAAISGDKLVIVSEIIINYFISHLTYSTTLMC